MDGDLVLSLVLFGLFFFALFYCYYSAQVRIKQEEYTLSACERGLLQYHHRFGGQEINTVSALADGRLNDLPPAYTKDSPPPPYETCMELENPPPYDACPLQMNAINNAAPNAENASVQIQITNSVRIPMESGGH